MRSVVFSDLLVARDWLSHVVSFLFFFLDMLFHLLFVDYLFVFHGVIFIWVYIFQGWECLFS